MLAALVAVAGFTAPAVSAASNGDSAGKVGAVGVWPNSKVSVSAVGIWPNSKGNLS